MPALISSCLGEQLRQRGGGDEPNLHEKRLLLKPAICSTLVQWLCTPYLLQRLRCPVATLIGLVPSATCVGLETVLYLCCKTRVSQSLML